MKNCCSLKLHSEFSSISSFRPMKNKTGRTLPYVSLIAFRRRQFRGEEETTIKSEWCFAVVTKQSSFGGEPISSNKQFCLITFPFRRSISRVLLFEVISMDGCFKRKWFQLNNWRRMRQHTKIIVTLFVRLFTESTILQSSLTLHHCDSSEHSHCLNDSFRGGCLFFTEHLFLKHWGIMPNWNPFDCLDNKLCWISLQIMSMLNWTNGRFIAHRIWPCMRVTSTCNNVCCPSNCFPSETSVLCPMERMMKMTKETQIYLNILKHSLSEKRSVQSNHSVQHWQHIQ